MKLLVDKDLKIEKQMHKGGWHYVIIPGIPLEYRGHQGLIRVKGSIDNYKIQQFNLLPVKTGEMMLVLNATVRKAINKKSGDLVRVKLSVDKSKVHIPEEILDSLLQSEPAYTFFQSLTESNKKYYIDWVLSARGVETKVTRIVKMMQMLERRQKFWDWPST